MKLVILLAAALALPVVPAALGKADAHACGGYAQDPNAAIETAAWRFLESSKLAGGELVAVSTVDHGAGTAAVEIHWTRQADGRSVTYSRTLQLVRFERHLGWSWTVRELGPVAIVPAAPASSVATR